MSHTTATHLNQIGIILGFFSFWFAAPEFIGEERLKSWEFALSKLFSRTPKIAEITFRLLLFLLLTAFYWVFAYILIQHPSFLHGWRMAASFVVASVGVFCGAMTVILTFMYVNHSIITKFATKIVSTLANDRKQRQRSLFFGAFLFIVASILQFLATFEVVTK